MKFDAEKENRKRQARPQKERRRRARINKSLLQLKSILLQSVNPETLFMSKLEKADLLELAKDYMQTLNITDKPNLCNTHAQGESGSAFSSYSVGFNDCVEEIMRFVDKTSETNTAPDLNNRLLEHLANFASSRDVIEKCANGSQGGIFEEHHAIDGLLALSCPMTKQFSNPDAVDQEANATMLQRPKSPHYESRTAKMDEERDTVSLSDLVSSEIDGPQTKRLSCKLENDCTTVTSIKECDISVNEHTEDSLFLGRMKKQISLDKIMVDDFETSQKIHITPNRVPLDSQPIRKRLAARFGDISKKSPRKVRPKKVKSCSTRFKQVADDGTAKTSSKSIVGT
ncbi:hairy/enhancer-of-split related with YRPW motif protein 1-like [Mya arenaria]|uniref:hairy/enhancer-of-split related with YRPW motif protein 1-like n=1 Tax=Mya arenaria TaxID=6604 RepID=UPI0022E0D9C3|nr:hairy/enhancer-of-split related with YRPW motif protein 1-like [Mya arenaria]